MLISTSSITTFDRWIDDEIEAVLNDIESGAPAVGADDLPLYDVLRYHLGLRNADLEPERSDPGKRLRSKLCLLCCDTTGADARIAVPVATAIELLHNFTLIHDDIQDMADRRRHRPTVWSLWGIPQAINAGDAMFAAAHVALGRSLKRGVSAEDTLDLSMALHAATLRIVEGQVLDLSFEKRSDVSPAEYLRMIEGKTAAIIRFACWAGARLGNAAPRGLPAYQDFGRAVGMGFQIRDDYLGVWGLESTTGKPPADDIRRRKQALPVLLLKERASASERHEVELFYAHDELAAQEIQRVIELMERYEVSDSVQIEVLRWHDHALDLLEQLDIRGESASTIAALVDGLVERTV